jgi:hypothetical protein
MLGILGTFTIIIIRLWWFTRVGLLNNDWDVYVVVKEKERHRLLHEPVEQRPPFEAMFGRHAEVPRFVHRHDRVIFVHNLFVYNQNSPTHPTQVTKSTVIYLFVYIFRSPYYVYVLR